jgi:transposase-like protein
MDNVSDNAKGGYRRIEVLTGPVRRRKWSQDDKARIVAEATQPGMVVSQIARRWQVTPQQVFDWRRQARNALAASMVSAEPVFVPIVPTGPVVMPEPHRRAHALVLGDLEKQLSLKTRRQGPRTSAYGGRPRDRLAMLEMDRCPAAAGGEAEQEVLQRSSYLVSERRGRCCAQSMLRASRQCKTYWTPWQDAHILPAMVS